MKYAFVGVAAFVIAFGSLLPGASADERTECVAAAEEGQKLRDDSKLNAARERFITCAKSTCPAIVSRQCVTWLQQVEQQLPSVTFHVTLDGRDVVDVAVFVDGERRLESLDGRPLALDPGVHKFRFVRAGAPDHAESVLINAGQKSRVL